MSGEHPIGRASVDAFYARQRREILDRLGAADDRALARPARRWLLAAALAAAAVAILGISLLLRPGPAPTPPDADATWGTDEIPLGAYGRWAEPVTLAGATEDPGSLGWLFEIEPREESTPQGLPEFLAPYASWDDPDDGTLQGDMI